MLKSPIAGIVQRKLSLLEWYPRMGIQTFSPGPGREKEAQGRLPEIVVVAIRIIKNLWPTKNKKMNCHSYWKQQRTFPSKKFKPSGLGF
jgi:hypothetical protein